MAIAIRFLCNFDIFTSNFCRYKAWKINFVTDLDAEFHVLKLLFKDFLPKISKGAGICENFIFRVKFLCVKYGERHGIFITHDGTKQV